MKILLLGGTTEALAIARTLPAKAIYSLAGLGRVPQDLPCQVRVGGYGGAEGLSAFLRSEGIDLLMDATHPYAAQISHNAAQAAARTRVPCWALRRPGWQAGPQDDWREISDWAELQRALAPFARPFFTLGREPLEHLQEIPPHQFWTLRLLDTHPGHVRARIIADRGPFALEAERALFAQGDFDVLISKNSGSAATQPKLQVARERGLPVLILRRPALPSVDREFASVTDLLTALAEKIP
ncbi:cobalt-precorrin-6A reductase [Pseudomonas oryzihabitans]|jgi:precorrin-6A/cobalt-precorrin-6A reductase|uniref:cobalt-precorrin-6A reductase n=1 Tax=Pseudomonas oryzihabitans TaxID=47885 RepID=UPI0025526FC7|nr:cobalt-precorrin-6A reductase [Pseudomonas oryzihabitans]MDK8266144.1 cobalt-precorrin-6A reductase [Pseudomonas oryzihabitans]